MPRRFVVLILLAWSVSSSATTIAGDQLKVATLNCEFMLRKSVHVKFGLELDRKEWTDAQRTQWDQPGFRDARFREAAKAVATVIKRIDADVVALCEVGNDTDVAELQREIATLGLNYSHRAVCHSTDTFTGQHVAVLSKRKLNDIKTSIPGREHYDRELDDPETEEDTGISKGMSVSFDVADRPLRLYVTHLSSERGGHEKDEQRIAQASIVRRNYLPQLLAGDFVIVAGDLNDHPGQPAIRRIRGRDDIQPDLLNTGDVKYFDSKKLGTRWTYEYLGMRNQLDYILLSESIPESCRQQGVKAETVEVTETIAGTEFLATDHRAFVVRLDFK
ncbi:MAG: endonuclease/exonuclease/phosphatase family protein [Planctomycetales bacterium]|nr:endonuclease/exonuclease/phosphatase family protein [Planctomycetales bacterium]